LKGYREIGSPTFSPDSEWIAFDGYQGGFYGSDAEVWIVRRDGKDLRKLTTGATPRWSPNGEQLLFMREKSKQPGAKLGIFIIDQDGKNERWICAGRWPDWSPDAKRITFSRDAQDVKYGGVKDLARIYVANADGTDAKVIAAGDCPSWSHDGKKIACAHRDPAYRGPVIRIVDLETERQRLLGYGWFRANWTADDKRLAANGPSPNGVIEMIEFSTESPVTPSEGPAKPNSLPTKFRHPVSPCYSADGQYLVFIAERPASEPVQ
jgi:Tol biopolymer transport system component